MRGRYQLHADIRRTADQRQAAARPAYWVALVSFRAFSGVMRVRNPHRAGQTPTNVVGELVYGGFPRGGDETTVTLARHRGRAM